MTDKISIEIDIENDEKIYKSAITRLKYLYPTLVFQIQLNTLTVEGEDINNFSKSELIKSINYIFYKEKIYLENLSLRKKLYESFN